MAVNRDQNYYCYCQHDCQCLDEGHGGGYYVAASADAIPELPGPCGGGGGGGDDDSSSLADCAADGDDCPAYWVGTVSATGVDQLGEKLPRLRSGRRRLLRRLRVHR